MIAPCLLGEGLQSEAASDHTDVAFFVESRRGLVGGGNEAGNRLLRSKQELTDFHGLKFVAANTSLGPSPCRRDMNRPLTFGSRHLARYVTD